MEIYGDYVTRVFLLVNTKIYEDIFKRYIYSLLIIYLFVNMRAIRKVRVYLLIYNETSKICQKCILDGDYVTLEFKLKFLQKQLSEQLLIFINDHQLLLGQHNRFLLIYRKVTVLFTMDVLKVYCIHGMYIKQIENKLLQFNSIQFNSFMTKVP